MAHKRNNQPVVDDSNIGLYLREISRFSPLSSAAERDIAIRIRKGDSRALTTLINANLRFVVSVAKNYQNQGMSLGDLINEGNLGLIKAAKRFDENKNFKFISYAVWWIRQAILQGLADNSRIVKVPLNKIGSIHRIGRTRNALEQNLMRLPTVTELAVEMAIPEKEVSDCLCISATHTSLNAPHSESDDGTLLDLLADPNGIEADASANTSFQHELLGEMFSILDEREAEVLRLYYGMDSDICCTLAEIGIQLNITRERVRQIKAAALKRLRRFDPGLLKDFI